MDPQGFVVWEEHQKLLVGRSGLTLRQTQICELLRKPMLGAICMRRTWWGVGCVGILCRWQARVSGLCHRALSGLV